MAEVTGTSASITQLVDLSGQLLARGYVFLSKVVGAPVEVRDLLTEAAAINSLLAHLQRIADVGTSGSSNDDEFGIVGKGGTLKECRASLRFVEQTLKICEHVHDQQVTNLRRKPIWPFEEMETKESLQRLRRLRDFLNDALQAGSRSSLKSIKLNQTEMGNEIHAMSMNMHAQISQTEADKVIAWICPRGSDGAYASLQNSLRRRRSGTGGWFLNSDLFNAWKRGSCASVWITGLPGSGKTIICSTVLDALQRSLTKDDLLLYFYCDRSDRFKTSYEDFAMTITHQALMSSSACLKYAQKLYNERPRHGPRLFPRDNYIPLIAAFSRYFSRVFVVVDALDESSDAMDITASLSRFLAYCKTSYINAKILMTSRFDFRLQQRHPYLTKNMVTLAENMQQDIDLYVHTEIVARMATGKLKIRNKALLIPMIETEILAKSCTFLDARLHLDHLTSASTDGDLKAMITSLPAGLDYTYETLLCNIISQHSQRIDETVTLFRCLVAAQTPMTVAQLAEILAMQRSDYFLEFDFVANDPYDVLEGISPFVMIDREAKTDGVVKLSHYSLMEYLCSERIQQGPAATFAIDKIQANVWLGKLCLQCLTYDVFNQPIDQSFTKDILTQYNFWEYASRYWHLHLVLTQSSGDWGDVYNPFLHRFLGNPEGSPCYLRWQASVNRSFIDYLFVSRSSIRSPILFCIAAGLHAISINLLRPFTDLDVSAADGMTFLYVAAACNNLPVTKWLVEHGATIDLPTNEPDFVRALTPLHIAAEEGAEQTFEYLLEQGADIHRPSTSGATPFYRACRGGNLKIVKRLKEQGADINARTWNDCTPLMDAIDNQHGDVAELLIEWGADVLNVCDGWDVLSLARKGNLYPVLPLLEKAVEEQRKSAT